MFHRAQHSVHVVVVAFLGLAFLVAIVFTFPKELSESDGNLYESVVEPETGMFHKLTFFGSFAGYFFLGFSEVNGLHIHTHLGEALVFSGIIGIGVNLVYVIKLIDFVNPLQEFRVRFEAIPLRSETFNDRESA